MQSYSIQQSTANQPLLFLLVSSTDHISPLTGATATVTLSKNGGTFASPAGAVSEIGSGWYKVAPNSTDSNTQGPLALHATATGADPTDVVFPVVAYNPLSATNLGLSNLDATVSSRSTFSGGAVASVTGNVGGNVVGSVGSVAGNVAGSVASVAGAVGSVTGNVGGNVVGSVGSVTGAVGSVTAAVTVGTNNDKTGYSLTQAFPANFAAMGITAAGKLSEVVLVDTLTTYTGNTPQTGDSFARIGATGSGLTSLASASSLSTLATAVGTPMQAGDPVTLDMTGAVPTINAAQTVGDCLNAARAQGFGKWAVDTTAKTLTLFADDGTTAVRTFTLDSATAPTSRT